MKLNIVKASLIQKAYRLVSTFACLVILAFGWQGVFSAIAPSATAAPTHAQIIALNNNVGDNDKANIKTELDRIVGVGTSDRLEGEAEQATGKAQRQVGKISGQAEGTTKQIQGQTKETVGKAKSAIEEAQSEVEEKSEDFIDSVKNFFGQ